MEIDRKIARGLSRIGIRATYGQALYEVAQSHNSVIAMSADLGRSSGLNQLRLNLPSQFVNAGIAEQNMVGVAAGMASEGFQVFASSFAPFISMRASEQVRMNLGYMSLPVKLVALGSGVSMGFLGNSHYGLEDVAVMRSIPGMTVVSPCDCVEVRKVVAAAVTHDGPMYIRLTGAVNAPVVHVTDYTFEFGKINRLREGDGSLCIIATGSGVAIAQSSAETLEELLGIRVTVLNCHTIKPLDENTIVSALSAHKLIVTIEEHTIIGGLGSVIAELKADLDLSSTLMRIGIPDCYVATGEYSYVLEKSGLSREMITERIQEKLKTVL